MRATPVKTIFTCSLILLALLTIGCYSDEGEEEVAVQPYIVNETEGEITTAIIPSDRPMELRGEFGCSYYCSPDSDVFAVVYSSAGTYSVKVRYNVPGIGGTYEYRDVEGGLISALSTTAAYEDTVENNTTRLISVNQGSYFSYSEYDYAIEISKK